MAASPTSYNFSFQDLARMMIREAGIEKGLWKVGLNLGFSAANMGPDNSRLRPTALVHIDSVSLSLVDAPDGLTVDASEVQKEAADAQA